MTASSSSRHLRRLPLPLVLVGAYLAVLLLIALLVRPPLLGWLGFGVVAMVSVAIGLLALYLWPRSRVNVDRLHPDLSGPYRLLVVLDSDVEPDELALAVASRTIARRSEVHVIAPATGSTAHLMTSDVDRDSVVAARRLSRTLSALGRTGEHVEGKVGAQDPIEATGDELATFPADEILFVGRLPALRRRADEDFERQARDMFGVHCSTVYGR